VKRIELLAPGGDINSIKAAILAGADAVYCGLNRFNARNRAENISFDDLQGILRFAHNKNCRVYLTLNIIIFESEFPALLKLLNQLVNTSIDGIIFQDLGLLYLLSKYFPNLRVHGSTQLTTHNEGQIKFLGKLGIERINLSRELNISEIKALTRAAEENHMQTEVFVHGSYCISFSGLCYMSSVYGGRSGNRGTCSQPCRDRFETTPAGKNYPLNLKDNSAYFDLRNLADAGIGSFKIEGRIKKFDYVYTVVKAWREQLVRYYEKQGPGNDGSELYKVFNRDFSNGFLKGDINKDMFIDNPRDFSIALNQDGFYKEQEENRSEIENKISQLDIEKAPVKLMISGGAGTYLTVAAETPDISFEVRSQLNLAGRGKEVLDRNLLMKRLKAINETEYFIMDLDLGRLVGEVYLPFNELTDLRNRLLFVLNGSKKYLTPVKVPALKESLPDKRKPGLSALISSIDDIGKCRDRNAEIFFQLPDAFRNECLRYKHLFKENMNLYPWFPPVIIGEDYNAAVDFLLELKPEKIVTNNSGIAFEAWKNGIPWIAGPYMNIVNSYSILNLKENTRIITDAPGVFSRFLIDIRDVPAGINPAISKEEIIGLYWEIIDSQH